ncbi:MAG: nuclear transport factor 2 family protein [Myxococcales bacterium]|nr:nuclear transport factor 2 family protein [Myxococcales bacterium]
MSAANKQVVRDYFARMAAGDATAADLLADDVTWWVPQSSSLAGTHAGKPAVLAMMAGGVDAYASDVPFEIDVERLVAEDDWVCAQVELRAAARDGTPYRNQYHFAMRVRDGRLVEVREYVDTLYVSRTLGI